jgi:hypothetical protein
MTRCPPFQRRVCRHRWESSSRVVLAKLASLSLIVLLGTRWSGGPSSRMAVLANSYSDEEKEREEEENQATAAEVEMRPRFRHRGRHDRNHSRVDTSTRQGQLCQQHEESLQESHEGYFSRHWYPDPNLVVDNCTDPTENPHGSYSSHRKDCVFAFHKIDSPPKWSAFRLNTACSDSNVMEDESHHPIRLRHQAELFPDTCIKDFRRCYSLDDDWKVYLPFYCRKVHPIPEGATHLSVDCTEDHQVKVGELAKVSKQASEHGQSDSSSAIYLDPHQKQQQKHEMAKLDWMARRLEKIFYVVLAVGVMACFVCICFCYAAGIRPLLSSSLDAGLSRRRTGGTRRWPVVLAPHAGSVAHRRPRQASAVSKLPTAT